MLHLIINALTFMLPSFQYFPNLITPKVKMDSCNKNIEIKSGTFRTWTCHSSKMKPLHVRLLTNKCPLDANIELWEDEYDMPYKMRIHSDNGKLQPSMITLLSTYRKKNLVAINNIGYDTLVANVFVNKNYSSDNSSEHETLQKIVTSTITLQSQTPCTYTCVSAKDVDITLKTDGSYLNGRIEMLQRSTKNKQIIEVYTKNGCVYPFSCRVHSHGDGDEIRIINTAHVDIPMQVSVSPLNS